jgi:hypothetical protein
MSRRIRHPYGGRVPEHPDVVDRLIDWTSFDLAPRHRQPAWGRVALATALAVALSLLADAALVALGTHLFPATKGYPHFAFGDYARLTVIGVLGAGAGWPVVTRICSRPRRQYRRLAVLVTAGLLLPDLYIWHQGQPGKAVGVLMAMHLAIALITYHVVVRVAPVGPTESRNP